MFGLLFIIFLIGAIILSFVAYSNDWEAGWVGVIFMYIFAGIFMITLVVGVCLIGGMNTTKRKIEMYEQENTQMEIVVSDAIEKYLQHEKDIFVEITPDQVDIYLVAYPEIQANELIKYQIDTLKTNREEIKSLKSKLIDVDLWRFLIYFG